MKFNCCDQSLTFSIYPPTHPFIAVIILFFSSVSSFVRVLKGFMIQNNKSLRMRKSLVKLSGLVKTVTKMVAVCLRNMKVAVMSKQQQKIIFTKTLYLKSVYILKFCFQSPFSNLFFNALSIMSKLFKKVYVVYFDQCLGAAHSKRWLK